MQLSLQAQASAATTINGLARSRARVAAPRNVQGDVLVTEVLAARDAKLGSLSLLSERELDARQAGASFGGCFSINAGLGVNAGANAEFFGLFNTETKVPLFNRDFELLKVSFPSPLPRSILPMHRLTRYSEVLWKPTTATSTAVQPVARQ